VPFGVEARHLDVEIRFDLPSGGQRGTLCGIASPFHGEHTGLGTAQRGDLTQQYGQGRKRSRHHRIERR
jgi:hypothetical protein